MGRLKPRHGQPIFCHLGTLNYRALLWDPCLGASWNFGNQRHFLTCVPCRRNAFFFWPSDLGRPGGGLIKPAGGLAHKTENEIQAPLKKTLASFREKTFHSELRQPATGQRQKACLSVIAAKLSRASNCLGWAAAALHKTNEKSPYMYIHMYVLVFAFPTNCNSS